MENILRYHLTTKEAYLQQVLPVYLNLTFTDKKLKPWKLTKLRLPL